MKENVQQITNEKFLNATRETRKESEQAKVHRNRKMNAAVAATSASQVHSMYTNGKRKGGGGPVEARHYATVTI